MNCQVLGRSTQPEAGPSQSHVGRSNQRCHRSPAAAANPIVAPALPRRRPPLAWRRLPWWGELVTIGCFYLLYEAVRAITPSDAIAAGHHADDLLDAESWAHIQVELTFNRALSSVHLLASLAAGYYTTLHFIVTPLMLVYLWRRRPGEYAELRSALVLTSTVALVVFWIWPVAPPRFAIEGASDTIVTAHLIGSANPHGIASLINEYAAMPSLHVGWAVWCALAVVCTSRSRWRHLAWLYPMATGLVVVATANHYVLDVVAGASLSALCLAFTRRPRAVGRSRLVGRELSRHDEPTEGEDRSEREPRPDGDEPVVPTPERRGPLQPAH